MKRVRIGVFGLVCALLSAAPVTAPEAAPAQDTPAAAPEATPSPEAPTEEKKLSVRERQQQTIAQNVAAAEAELGG